MSFLTSPREHDRTPPAASPDAAASTAIPGPMPVEDASRGLVAFRVLVHPRDVVFLKGILEASDGVASVFATGGGDLTIAAPVERVAELRRILADLATDIGARVIDPDPGSAGGA